MADPAGKARRFFRPTWAEIDLGALRSNLARFKERLAPKTKLLFVVKADGYGHGAVACAREAQRSRLADWLGVSSVEEGIELRMAGLRLPILILGSLYPFESFLAAAEHGLTPTVASLEAARALAAAAARLGRTVGCHLKVETGMGRIGVSPSSALAVARFLQEDKRTLLAGVYTHLSCADESASFTRTQLARFKGVVAGLRRAGSESPLLHAANSAAALRFPASRWDMVRPGLAVYGLRDGFEPVLSLKSKIVFIKTIPRGAAVSYGATFKAARSTRIATVPLGYADGLSRGLSSRGFALVGGRRRPIVGRITMDMAMLDVTARPSVHVGDDAVFIGRQGRERITAAELAGALDTIPYEVTCSIAARVPRVYK